MHPMIDWCAPEICSASVKHHLLRQTREDVPFRRWIGWVDFVLGIRHKYDLSCIALPLRSLAIRSDSPVLYLNRILAIMPLSS
jgi:hypothetical protein